MQGTRFKILAWVNIGIGSKKIKNLPSLHIFWNWHGVKREEDSKWVRDTVCK